MKKFLIILIIIILVILGVWYFTAQKESTSPEQSAETEEPEEKIPEPSEGDCVAESGKSMGIVEASEIALESECADQGILGDTESCNSNTGTWWINLKPYTEKEGCNPACVIDIETKAAEINWRCTGLIVD
jgi:hypothetical protein